MFIFEKQLIETSEDEVFYQKPIGLKVSRKLSKD